MELSVSAGSISIASCRDWRCGRDAVSTPFSVLGDSRWVRRVYEDIADGVYTTGARGARGGRGRRRRRRAAYLVLFGSPKALQKDNSVQLWLITRL
jgi:hypothetical protein